MLIGVALVVLSSCSGETRQEQSERADVEAVARAFVESAHAYDYRALRAATTDDVEIILFGRRMDLDAYETLLRGMEENGVELPAVEGGAFDTEIRGDVAYTSWRTGNWLEVTILNRNENQWLVDRTFSMRMQSDEP